MSTSLTNAKCNVVASLDNLDSPRALSIKRSPYVMIRDTTDHDVPGFMTPWFMTPWFMTPGFMTPGFITPWFMAPWFMTPWFMTPWFMTHGS